MAQREVGVVGQRWLRGISVGMAVFCGFVALMLTISVVITLAGAAVSEWSGKSTSWRASDPAGVASAAYNRTVLIICPAGAVRCRPSRPPEIKPYISAMLGSLTLQVPLMALAYGLFQACACFVGIARGKLLARRTVDRLVRFAVAGLGFVLLTPFAGRLGGWVADGSRGLMSWATGDRSFQVSAYTANYANVSGLLTVIYAVTLTVIAVVMVKASTIADDHAQIV
jgi:hypothetical protein